MNVLEPKGFIFKVHVVLCSTGFLWRLESESGLQTCLCCKINGVRDNLYWLYWVFFFFANKTSKLRGLFVRYFSFSGVCVFLWRMPGRYHNSAVSNQGEILLGASQHSRKARKLTFSVTISVETHPQSFIFMSFNMQGSAAHVAESAVPRC